MPAQKKNNIARVLIPAFVIAAAIGVVIGVLSTSTPKPKPSDSTKVAADETTTEQPASSPAPSATEPAPAEPSTPTTTPETTAPNEAAPPASVPGASPADDPESGPTGFLATTPVTARSFGAIDPANLEVVTLGSLDPATGYELRVSLTPLGAGIHTIQAADIYDTVSARVAAETNPGEAEGHYTLQTARTYFSNYGKVNYRLISMGAINAAINGVPVDLFGSPDSSVWRLAETNAAPGVIGTTATFEAILEDATGTPHYRITRTYTLEQGRFDLSVEQNIENLTAQPANLVWTQHGPLNLNPSIGGYRLDLRRVRAGYLLDPKVDPSRQIVKEDRKLTRMSSVLDKSSSLVNAGGDFWPNPSRFKQATDLVWIGQTNRYFTVAVHTLLDPNDPNPNKSLAIAQRVNPIALTDGIVNEDTPMSLGLVSAPQTIAPGQSLDLSFGVYAGPMDERGIKSNDDPRIAGVQLQNIVAYNIGGMCAFCTFEWLGKILLTVLHVFHGFTLDWAVSIMLLVFCVRLVLHPIFKRSQINLQRFSKDMQRVAPKQKKLQEKYKGDQKKLREEMAKLMKTEDVHYAGALGCLPMLLQSPIWIALYAMLYMNFELRHEPAFWGAIQSLTGGNWLFLADLSRSDNFIPLGFSFDLPLLGALMGTIDSINILPLMLGVVFFIQQKYMSPPPSATMTPEQQTQQKIVKVMMVVMFPVFMYNAPAALTLYFITNSTLGIFESKWVRAHIDTLELEKHPSERTNQPAPRKRVMNRASGESKANRDRFKRRN